MSDDACPNCGAPMRDDLQQHIHETDGTCDYAAGLRERIALLGAACRDNNIYCACGTLGYCEAGPMCGTGG